MSSSLGKFWEAAYQMVDSFFGRLPSLIVGLVVFLLFYTLSVLVSRVILRTTRKHRPNLGVVFAFQNILQNFLAGLLLLWAEPFRIGDEIKLDPYEGAVEEIRTRATIIKTYDGRRVVIPSADLFTHSVTVNTALDIRRWEYDLAVHDSRELAELKSLIVNAVNKVQGVLSDPPPEVLVMDLGDPDLNAVKVRVLWWTKAPRQHEMLASYDRVLTAIRQTLNRSAVGPEVAQNRAA